MSETQLKSQAEVEPAGTEQPAGTRPKGPFTAPRALPPASFNEPSTQDGGETTASTPPDDALLDPDCEVIAIGHAKFYLRYADWLPPLAEDEFDGLTASIREHGIQQPVVVYRLLNNHFDVIDGLHRLKVAQALGFDLMQIPLNILDQGTNVKEQKALAWSLNADRRHLTKEQRQARALELRKEGLSYRAIAEELGVGRGTIERDIKEAGVPLGTPEGKTAGISSDMPETVTGKDGKAYPAVVPAPTAGEIDIAREFIIDALRKKYSPLARGQLYRDASRIAGASGIKRKAFDAALDAMIEAHSVKEHINPHGAREYHFAYVVDRLEQRTGDEDAGQEPPDNDDELNRFLNAAVPYIIHVIKNRGPRQSREELDRLLDLERAREQPRKTLIDFLTFYRIPAPPPSENAPAPVDSESDTKGDAISEAEIDKLLRRIPGPQLRMLQDVYLQLSLPKDAPSRTALINRGLLRVTAMGDEWDFDKVELTDKGRQIAEAYEKTLYPDGLPAAATVVDELRTRFDEDAVTLAGRTDDGARHRAIEIARKLITAGIWNGSDWIEFDAYALHDKLFGVNPVAPEDLVEDDDYWFVTPPGQGDEPAAAEEAETDDAPDDALAEIWQTAEAYPMAYNALQSMTFYVGQLRHAQSIPWDDVDDRRRVQARELLDTLTAAAADLPDILSEISRKLGAA